MVDALLSWFGVSGSLYSLIAFFVCCCLVYSLIDHLFGFFFSFFDRRR